MELIETSALTKDYGDSRGIFDVNISVSKGEMLGFVGTNGSGKTTTIRSILGFIKPTKGKAYVNGLSSWEHSAEIVKNIGYVPGEIAFPDLRTGTEFLRSQAYFTGIKDMTKADRLIEKLQLDPSANLKRMSKGMKQKTAVVAAFMGDKDILVLDEPTTGLDPLMRESFMEIVEEEHKNGKTIIMSSHMFEELEKLCDKVALISNGEIVDVADMDKIRNPSSREYKIEFAKTEDYEAFKSQKFMIVRDQPQYQQVTVRISCKYLNALFGELKKYEVRLIAEVKYNLDRYFKCELSRQALAKKEAKNVQ